MSTFHSVSGSLLLALLLTVAARAEDKPYVSPYSVKFSEPLENLIGDILNGDRGKPEKQSTVPFEKWYSAETRRKYGAWGPPSKVFEPPAGIADKPAAWKRQRVIAIAMRYEGYSYQHHHLPDWSPPGDWPWKEVGRGHNDKGVDCSNFTGLVYNLALGLKMSGDITAQAEATEVKGKDQVAPVQRLEKPAAYRDCIRELRTGDLLYVRDKAGSVSHVVLWVGEIGRSVDGAPLVLDSTSTGHLDSRGEAIPDGVHLRPFNEKGWYWQSLSHVHRIISD